MGKTPAHLYLIALGSNRRLPQIGGPRAILEAALMRLGEGGWRIEAVSRIVGSAPIGPSRRRYANAAALVSGEEGPPAALAAFQAIEAEFARRRRGARWQARTLDIDIVLWGGGDWRSASLTIPHPLFRERAFVLGPAAEIAPHWRDPATGLTVRQLAARARKRRHVARSGRRPRGGRQPS